MAQRRGKGEGSITQLRDGRWQARVTYWEDGRRKRKAFYGRTRREAQDKLRKALADLEAGLPLPDERVTVGEYLNLWLENTARGSVRPSTYESYARLVRLHIVPSIGKLRLARLSPRHLTVLYREVMDKGLSPRTAQYIHAVLHRALRQAVRWNMIARNPADLVDAPRPRRKEITPLTPEQVRALLESAQGDRYEALYVLAVTTGLRLGELLGLKWTDVDWESGEIRVRRTLLRTANGLLQQPTKSGKGRVVKLPTLAVDALRRHRTRQSEERSVAGQAWDDQGLIFPNQIGRPTDRQNLVRRSFKRLLAKAGLPDIRFHDLRHTSATLLLAQGVHPKVVQERLGHSNISVTLDIYSHVLPDLQKEAADQLDRVLAGYSDQPPRMQGQS